MPKRSSARTGSELFVVDNSQDDWNVLRYLHDWCQISSSIDVASAYFELGSLLALNGEWQKIDEIRVLMGDEVSRRTKAAFVQALSERKARLDASIEVEKERDDFLDGVPAIVQAIRDGKIKFRIYRKARFHAKAYITHARLEVVGSSALVGSSNFTRPGLTDNIELNVQITGGPVSVLQEWFEEHWDQAEDITLDMLQTIERHIQAFTPFDVYARSLHELFRDRALSAGEWEKHESTIFQMLDGYQREGYGQLLDIARKYDGAFLCDGVGLGKTFVGLMLLERLVRHEKKRVVLLVPKSARESVWMSNLRRYLPDLVGGAFSGLEVLNHTDLGRPILDERLEAIKSRADAIIIDEAHNFRNPGIAGEGDRRPSRPRILKDIAQGKQLFLLTATPVNNSILDLMHLIELFAGDGAKLKQAPLGIQSLQGHFRSLEKRIRKAEGDGDADINVTSGEAREVFESDPVVQNLVVQRSRAYVKASQALESHGRAAQFPTRDDPKVVSYHLSPIQQRLLNLIAQQFDKHKPLLTLAIYNPEEFRRKGQGEAADFDRGRLKQVVILIRVGFLKRLESSTPAFEASCRRLLVKLLTFVERHAASSDAEGRFSRWKGRHADLLARIAAAKSTAGDDSDADEDVVTPEMLEDVIELDNETYDVPAIVDECYGDMDLLAMLLETLRDFTPADDGKLTAMIALLKSDPVLAKHKVLIFSEFADTGHYLARELKNAGIDGVAQIDSNTKIERGEVIKRFAPYYNGSNSKEQGTHETRVLVASDVLSEGLNLQDATRLINYDLHWNPVRLMQRIGRVDRRMNPEIEAAIVRDHPDQATLRGHTAYWNFLPQDELDALLNLYARVAGKTLRISRLFGIEGKKLLTPTDDYDELKNFNEAYEGEESSEERLRLELTALLNADPKLEARLDDLPNRIFSGREAISPNARGVFFCWSLPGPDPNLDPALGADAWTGQSGEAKWYYRDLASGTIADSPAAIADLIRSTPETPRHLDTPRETLRAALIEVEKHIRNTYLRQVQAPVGVKPILKAWMELN
jgi:superfamily II DNA or RNA helicase